MYRGLGEWPNQGFKELSHEQQQEFMRSIDGMTGAQKKAHAEEVLTSFESHESYYDHGGEFQPLSVWATRGYDTAAIELYSKPADKMQHPVFGETYRVQVVTCGNRGQKGTRRESTAKSKRQLNAIADGGGVGAPADNAASAASNSAVVPKANPPETSSEPESPSSTSTSSSSSSSSSSDDKKKNKKNSKNKSKKDKKKSKQHKKNKSAKTPREETLEECKARLKAEKEAEKEAIKAKVAKKKLAQTIVGKVSGARAGLQATIHKVGFAELPQTIKDPCEAMMAKLDKYETTALAIIADDGNGDLPDGVTDAKDLGPMLASAKRHNLLANQILATMARA